MSGKPRLLLDEMLSADIAKQLRNRGLDALAVVENPALVSTPDEDLLVHTTGEGRCLVTANISDFAVLSTRWRSTGRLHGGIIYLTNGAFPRDRSFVGAVVRALALTVESGQTPHAGIETYLRSVAD